MLHPLFSTLIQRPDLVVDHASAYAALFHQEASAAGSEVLVKVVAWTLAILFLMLFLGLSGTALMLGLLHEKFNWILLIVPSIALLMVMLAVVYARKPFKSERFPELKAQIQNDTRALRMAA